MTRPGRPKGPPRQQITLNLKPEVLAYLREIKAKTGKAIGHQIEEMVEHRRKK